MITPCIDNESKLTRLITHIGIKKNGDLTISIVSIELCMWMHAFIHWYKFPNHTAWQPQINNSIVSMFFT